MTVVVVVSGGFKSSDLVGLFDGGHVDSDIAGNHKDNGNVEGNEGADESERYVDNKRTHIGVHRKGAGDDVFYPDVVPVVEDGDEGNKDWGNPAEGEHHTYPADGQAAVQKRPTDGQVAVDGKARQMEDGDSTHHDVDAGREFAQNLAQKPDLVVELLVYGERHHKERNTGVGNSQGHHEGIGYRLQLFVSDDR